MIFKTTILKSNPQIIRVFAMEPGDTVRNLLKTVQVVHNWSIERETLRLLHNGRELLMEETLRDHFDETTSADEWMIEGKFPERMYSMTPEPWNIRLEVESLNPYMDGLLTPEQELPCLLRFRGLNPEESQGSVRAWNLMARSLLMNQQVYNYGHGYVDKSMFEPDADAINEKLQKLVKNNGMDLRIDWSRTVKTRDLFEMHKLNDLKEIIHAAGLPIDYTLRKADMVTAISYYYKEKDLYKRVLDEMSLAEFENFQRQISDHGGFFGRELPVCNRYGLIGRDGFGEGRMISKELVQSFESRMETDAEKMIRRKQLKEVITCACRLYGVFSVEVLEDLAEVMYPDLDIYPYLHLEWVDNHEHGIIEAEHPFGEDFRDIYDEEEDDGAFCEELLYDRTALGPNAALSCWNAVCNTGMYHYIPSCEEAKDIARGKAMKFDKTAEEALLKELKNVKSPYSFYSNERILEVLYAMCHLNTRLSEIPSYLRRNYGFQTNPARFGRLLDLLRIYRGDVRQIMFCGHTANEARELFHLTLKEE